MPPTHTQRPHTGTALPVLLLCALWPAGSSPTARGDPLDPLAWQSPMPAALGPQQLGCRVEPVATAAGVATRQVCTALKGAVITPSTPTRPELRLPRGPAVVQLFSSPSWNGASNGGAPMIWGATGTTAFLYVQLLNSSGAYLDACPIPTFQQTLWPTCPYGTTAANPGVSPALVANVSEVGYKPPLPRVELTLLRELVVSDGLLITREGAPVDVDGRARLFLQLYAALLPGLAPHSKHAVPQEEWQALALRSERDLLRRNGSAVAGPAGAGLLRTPHDDCCPPGLWVAFFQECQQ